MEMVKMAEKEKVHSLINTKSFDNAVAKVRAKNYKYTKAALQKRTNETLAGLLIRKMLKETEICK